MSLMWVRAATILSPLPPSFAFLSQPLVSDLSRDMGVNIRWKNCYKVHSTFYLNVKKDRSFLIVPTTFKPKQETSFTLHVFGDYPTTLELY